MSLLRRQVAAPGPAPSRTLRRRAPRVDLHPDGAYVGHSRAVPRLPRLQVPAFGWCHQGGATPSPHGAIQYGLAYLRLYPLHSIRRPWGQLNRRGYCHILRLRLEPHHGCAGSGQVILSMHEVASDY